MDQELPDALAVGALKVGLERVLELLPGDELFLEDQHVQGGHRVGDVNDAVPLHHLGVVIVGRPAGGDVLGTGRGGGR